MLNLMVIDLEATSAGDNTTEFRREIIEIGAVKCFVSDNIWQIEDGFDYFVKPQINPQLNDFIKKLTTITQKDVSQAQIFPAVLDEFKKWTGNKPSIFASFGKYDFDQMKADCNLYREQFPFSAQHCNLKKVISKKMGVEKPGSCEDILKNLQITPELPEHRALNDVKNIIKICQKLQVTQQDIESFVKWY